MNAPKGLMWWIAFERSITPKDKEADLAQAIEWCKATGATSVALRAGAGGNADADMDARSIRAFLDAGIDPYVWVFAYQATQALEVGLYNRAFGWGAKGAIINAEFEYATATRDDALRLVEGIRVAWDAHGSGGESFVAHAPPDYLGAQLGHPPQDELISLDECCDLIMPQVYAWEHDDRGHAYHLDRIVKAYDARGYADKLAPIGCSYRPKVRGGKPVPRMDDEPQRVALDVISYLEHPGVIRCPCPSLYTLDAIGWINGPADQVISTLAARVNAQKAPTLPPPPTVPDLPSFSSAATPLRAGEGEKTILEDG